jgi:rubredoxin
MSETDPAITLTDTKPVPRDLRCPSCLAPESARVRVGVFGGPPKQACGNCGHEFPREE